MSMQDLVSPQEIGFRNMANRSYASLQIGIGHGEGTSTQGSIEAEMFESEIPLQQNTYRLASILARNCSTEAG
ncbi:predicted protein [Arabidopsis lyrata subsp. lyrata]|uniref:Predicted protein n=1 Tax=Arabidopsis lyrata subsp. lyrata TaxID=81972 RepID=D7MHW3_ARALL|nr:predicted protein [Arabidopsis lyrata subsp. lyrata]